MQVSVFAPITTALDGRWIEDPSEGTEKKET
jgi:hypothetical protein